jgi:vesicle-fusing ATPase
MGMESDEANSKLQHANIYGAGHATLQVIGLTNRKDLIDPALLRPGRLEVHLEINAPEEEGRQEILEIHLRKLRNTGRLAEGVWDAIPEIAKKPTRGFTGAELAGLVRSAASFALERSLEKEGGQDGRQVMVSLSDMERALSEVRPARLGARGWLSKMLKAR